MLFHLFRELPSPTKTLTGMLGQRYGTSKKSAKVHVCEPYVHLPACPKKSVCLLFFQQKHPTLREFPLNSWSLKSAWCDFQFAIFSAYKFTDVTVDSQVNTEFSPRRTLGRPRPSLWQKPWDKGWHLEMSRKIPTVCFGMFLGLGDIWVISPVWLMWIYWVPFWKTFLDLLTYWLMGHWASILHILYMSTFPVQR